MNKEKLKMSLVILGGELKDAISNENGCFDEIASKAMCNILSCKELLDDSSKDVLVSFDRSVYDVERAEWIDGVFISTDKKIMFTTSNDDEVYSRNVDYMSRSAIINVVNEIIRMCKPAINHCPLCGSDKIAWLGWDKDLEKHFCVECQNEFGVVR